MQEVAAYQEPIHLTVTSDHPGNIFGSGDARELYLYLTNRTQQNLKGTLDFRYLTHSGERLDEGEPVEFELSCGKEKSWDLSGYRAAEIDTALLQTKLREQGAVVGYEDIPQKE